MQKIGQINAFGRERPVPTEAERKQLEKQQKQQERERGYQQLLELCRLGECNAAKQLAIRHSSWGYEVADGQVVERLEEF